MFTGIIQGYFPVDTITRETGLTRLSIQLNESMIAGIEIGASVAVNGVCLTVTSINANGLLSFDVIHRTESVTNLNYLKEGSLVNIERSLTMGQEIGGHMLSGHVDGTAVITQIEKPKNNFVVTIKPPKTLMRFLLAKGYIGLNGASLTIADKDESKGEISVHIIPETLRMTTFHEVLIGDRLNVEVDRQTQAIVETVENYLRDKKIIADR